ncbi:MAG: RHS repeat domain-containing protein [Bacteroidales bacterium]
MQINGESTYSNVYFEKTLYTSPYLVMTEEEYTKHYFIEGERVCSRVGGGFGPADVPPTSPPLDFIYGDEEHLAEGLKKYTTRNIDCTGYPGGWDFSEILEPAYDMGNECELASYFYHPDHLGSAVFISDFQGQAEQHLQYLPFGELWVNQQNYYFDTRYKFSAKELDSESGYNYFGARYYDSELSNWLSVDPLADERSWVSPYSYVQNSPVNRVDPSGALDNPIYDTEGKFLGTDDKGLQGKAIVMNKDDFSQGMSHEEALSHSLVAEGLSSDATA